MATQSNGEEEAWIRSKPGIEENGDPVSVRYKEKDHENICSRRSGLEKILLLLLAVTLAALLAVSAMLILSRQESDKRSASPAISQSSRQQGDSPGIVEYQGAEVCLTKACINAASHIDSSIDYSVAPCDDFYKFSCGRWMKQNAIPEDQGSLSTFGVLNEKLDIVLRNLLQAENQPGDLESVKKARDLFASCFDLDGINKRGDQVLRDFLSDLGGWPITDPTWDDRSFDLVDTLVKVNQMDQRPLFRLYVNLDTKDSTVKILTMDQPLFGLPGQKYYLVPRDDKMLAAYEELILGVARLQGITDEVKARQDVKEIVDFEIRLANISVPDEQRRDNNALYNPMTLGEIQGNYSQILNWHRYVTSLMLLPEVSVLDVTENEVFIVRTPQYFTKLTDVIQTTPKRVLANYIMWRMTHGVLGTQGSAYREVHSRYKKILIGSTSEPALYRQCTSYTNSNLGLAVGRMFIRENFKIEAKSMVLEMIKDLQTSFNELLDDLDWMDDETKRVAKEKNDVIQPRIGYPEEILNDTYIEMRYANVTYHREKYFENVLENRRELFIENMRDLRKPYNKTRWETAPSTINAFYSWTNNQILFPAGILQPPFFSSSFPKYVNYGGVGYVIGHELTHGFDDIGRQYDKDGNLAQWWNDAAVKRFKEKAQCIINQYGNFTVEEIGLNMNGVNTQGENIADNGGLKQAFKAYRDWVARNGKEEPMLPGLGFTNDQLFFINFAQIWCNLEREATSLNRLRTGVHSPSRFRVIGSAQNSADFSRVFNCPKTSYMNPENKCNVW